MIKELIKKGASKIGDFLGKIRVGGFTVSSVLKRNRENTIGTLLDVFRSALLSDVDLATYSQTLEKTIKTRKRAALNTLRNTFSAVRGQARAILATGKSGIWSNVSVLDERTTEVCRSHVGMTWNTPYSQIPNKPPRIPPTHPCRSILLFREDGTKYEEEKPFMEQFNSDEKLQKELLGTTRYEAYKSGSLEINSYGAFEKSVLNTLDDLGLK